jgi:hypothetical protein
MRQLSRFVQPDSHQTVSRMMSWWGDDRASLISRGVTDAQRSFIIRYQMCSRNDNDQLPIECQRRSGPRSRHGINRYFRRARPRPRSSVSSAISEAINNKQLAYRNDTSQFALQPASPLVDGTACFSKESFSSAWYAQLSSPHAPYRPQVSPFFDTSAFYTGRQSPLWTSIKIAARRYRHHDYDIAKASCNVLCYLYLITQVRKAVLWCEMETFHAFHFSAHTVKTANKKQRLSRPSDNTQRRRSVLITFLADS